jgi:hypothetical protein
MKRQNNKIIISEEELNILKNNTAEVSLSKNNNDWTSNSILFAVIFFILGVIVGGVFL